MPFIFNDRWLRFGLPLILGVVLYSIYVLISQFAEPENYSIYFLSLQVVSFYAYYELARWSIIFVEKKWSRLNTALSIFFQFLLTLIPSVLIGILLYVIVKQLHIIFQPQNDVITLSHLTTKFLGVFVSVIIIFSINFGLNYLNKWTADKIAQEKMKREQITSQYELLKSQVDPHFLFNSFNTLHSLIKEAPGMAEAFLLNLSRIMRYSLKKKSSEVVTLAEELKVLRSYLFILKNRFGEDLELELRGESKAVDDKYLLPMSLLMLVENAVKHNEIGPDHRLRITVEVRSEEVAVKNNITRRKEQDSGGAGLENLKERYAFFSDNPVAIEENAHFFTVNIPLLALEKA